MSKLNEDIIIRYLENRCSEEDFVLINEWMKESDENAGGAIPYGGDLSVRVNSPLRRKIW